MSKVTEVATFMANNAGSKAKDIMKKFKVSKPYAYKLMTEARKQYLNRRDEAMAKPKMRMMGAVTSNESVGVERDAEGYRLIELGGRTARMLEADLDMVNHPPHYKKGGIETIDFIEAKNLNYHLGNVVKYITRADHKGDRLENLKKAQWYLNREIEKSSK